MYCHPKSILAVRSSLSLWGFHGKFAPHLLSCAVSKNMLLTMSHTQINRRRELYRLSRVPFRLWYFPWNLQQGNIIQFQRICCGISQTGYCSLDTAHEENWRISSHRHKSPLIPSPDFKSFSGHAVKWHSTLKFRNSFQLKGEKKKKIIPYDHFGYRFFVSHRKKVMKEIVITSILSWSLQDLRAFPRLWLIPSIKEKGRHFAGR